METSTEVAGSSSQATATDSCEGVEMTTVGEQNDGHDCEGDGVQNEMKVTVHSSNTQEPCVVFIVKDVTDTDWQKSRYSCSLPLSTAVTDLYSAVAKEAGILLCTCR